MKRNNSELAVEYSFGQYQTWVAEIVRSEGGQLQSSAGDGMMCLFEDDLAAVRAAQRLLQDLSRFNTQQNHLKSPFQIRCGVHAGEVAMEPNMPIGNLQSPQIDYAAALQKHAEPNSILVSGSVSTEALARIGQGEAHPEAVYSWKMP
jgi:class 3 adenylate cyclase